MDEHNEDPRQIQADENYFEQLQAYSEMISVEIIDSGGFAGMSTATPPMQQVFPGNGYEDRDDFQAHHNFLEPLPTLSSAPAINSKAGMVGGGLAGTSAATPKMQQFILGNGSGGITAINGRTCGGSHGLVSVGVSLELGKEGSLKPKKASGSHKRSSVKNEMRRQNAASEATANGDSEIVRTDVEISTPAHAKQRKLVSNVWKGFDRVIREDGNVRATCKICKKDFDGSSKKGTTHLKNHLKRCEKRRNRDEDQALISPVEMGDLTAPSVITGNVVFDQKRCCLDLAKMIIKRQYPLNIVERELFKTFLNSFQPKLELPSQENIMADILRIYQEGKEELLMYLDKLSCRFGLAIDYLKDDLEKCSYICFYLHFIDNDWELKEKIIAIRKSEYKFEAAAVHRTCKSVVLSWKIQRKLCPLLYFPEFNNAYKSVGKLLVEAGLDVIDDILQKIHKSIEYVIETPSRKQKFQDAVNQVKFHDREVSQDVPTRSDLFLTLEGALRLREVFCVLGKNDCDFNFNPSTEEWDKAGVIYKYLKVIYDYPSSLAGTKCLTTDVYFARLLHIYNLFPCESEYDYLRSMAATMKMKFIGYWKASGRGLVIASILDPRFKTSRLDSVCQLIYGSAYPYSDRILDDVANCYYCLYVPPLRPFDRPYSFTEDASENTEFRRYLEEPTCPSDEEFDILGWWRINTPNFPTLARMARDFLALHMLNVFSNSALGTEIMRINQAFNVPDPEVLEALICGQNWLETPKR